MLRHLLPLLLLVALAGCGKAPSPEDEIRELVATAERAAEARDSFTLHELVADDYQDGRGNGADGIRRYVHGYLIAHQSVHLLVRIDEIELKARDVARLRATVGMAGRETKGDSAWDLAADVYEFDVTLVREDGDWRVSRADWHRGGLAE